MSAVAELRALADEFHNSRWFTWTDALGWGNRAANSLVEASLALETALTERDAALLEIADQRTISKYNREQAEAAEARAEELEKALATADYLIDRYRKVHSGKPVRDLDEAEEAYRCARALSHTLTEEGKQ